MLGKATLITFTALLLGASVMGFAQIAAQTVITPAKPKAKAKVKQPPRIIIPIPDTQFDPNKPIITRRLSIHDPSPEDLRDRALLRELSAIVTKGHAARDAGDLERALEHYQSALSTLENTMLGIDSDDVRFGIGMIAPPIAQTYAALDDDRAAAAAERIAIWQACGLMANTGEPDAHFDPARCGPSLTFELFRATGA